VADDAIEVVVRLGETIVDIQYVTDRYALAGEVLELEPGVTRRGLMDITMTRVERPGRSVPRTPHGDRRGLTYIAASLAVHLLVWGVTPEPSEEVVERRPTPHLVRLAPRSRPPAPRMWELGNSPAYALNGGGSPTSGAAGAAGGNSPSLKGRIQIAKRQEEPQIARASAIAKAGQAGIIGALEHAHGFDAIVGRADLSSGFDRTDVHAPLYGGEGAGRGTFGLARGGTGDSAGCAGGATARSATARSRELAGAADAVACAAARRRCRGRICAGPRPCYIARRSDKAIVRR
jgi:hypothetical protein